MEREIVERISVGDDTLVINRHYMAVETSDGMLHPADLDEYGQYQPILELIRMTSYNADMTNEITEETRAVLNQALLGQHPLLSHPLYCSIEDTDRNASILKVINPKTEEDYVRTLSLICSEGLFCSEEASYPFTNREELRDYLCEYMDARSAYTLSEVVRKGLLYDRSEESEALLLNNILRMFSRIKYLPKKAVIQKIVHYAILAANSLIKNGNEIILK